MQDRGYVRESAGQPKRGIAAKERRERKKGRFPTGRVRTTGHDGHKELVRLCAEKIPRRNFYAFLVIFCGYSFFVLFVPSAFAKPAARQVFATIPFPNELSLPNRWSHMQVQRNAGVAGYCHLPQSIRATDIG